MIQKKGENKTHELREIRKIENEKWEEMNHFQEESMKRDTILGGTLEISMCLFVISGSSKR